MRRANGWMRCLALACMSMLATGAARAGETEIVARSLVNQGSTARLEHAMAKARRGEPVTFGVIGGSITEGAGANPREQNRWANLVWDWWKATYPEAQINYVNAGIGATGSDYGVFRLERDLLHENPDVVVVEFAVNDVNTRASAETLEGIVRQVLAQPNQPAVLLYFCMNNRGENAQPWFSKVGEHYGLPMVSYRDALWPEVAAKRIAFSDITADTIHPNNRGHRYAADFLIALLKPVANRLPADATLPAIPPVPEPLFTDVYAHTAMHEFGWAKKEKNFRPARVEGKWFLHGESWLCDTPGAVVEFSVSGDLIYLQHDKTSSFFAPKVEVRVDDRAPQIIDCYWAYPFTAAFTSLIGKDLGPGPHTVSLKLLAEKNPKCPAPPENAPFTHRFSLQRIFAAGAGSEHEVAAERRLAED